MLIAQPLKRPGIPTRSHFASPPSRGNEPKDSFVFSQSESAPIKYEASWAPSTRSAETRAKLSGGQVALLGLGTLAAFGGVVGAFVSSTAPTPPSAPQTENVPQIQTPTAPAEIELARTETVQEKKFSDSRTLLLDRSDRVHANQFAPDRSMASEVRGNTPVYEESYIAGLVNRDLTSVPEGAPRFTALDVDPNQGSKIYFDSHLNSVDYGYGSIKSEKFFTRPTRMNGRGSGITDEITQYHLSCIYRLEEPTTIDGVQLDAGVYRLVTLAPASRVATPSMQRSVCPGHTLLPTGSGIAGDYMPSQQNKSGEALRVNPDDIVQVWTLTPEEAVKYQ